MDCEHGTTFRWLALSRKRAKQTEIRIIRSSANPLHPLPDDDQRSGDGKKGWSRDAMQIPDDITIEFDEASLQGSPPCTMLKKESVVQRQRYNTAFFQDFKQAVADHATVHVDMQDLHPSQRPQGSEHQQELRQGTPPTNRWNAAYKNIVTTNAELTNILTHTHHYHQHHFSRCAAVLRPQQSIPVGLKHYNTTTAPTTSTTNCSSENCISSASNAPSWHSQQQIFDFGCENDDYFLFYSGTARPCRVRRWLH